MADSTIDEIAQLLDQCKPEELKGWGNIWLEKILRCPIALQPFWKIPEDPHSSEYLA